MGRLYQSAEPNLLFIAGVILAKLLLPYVGKRKGLLFLAVMGLAVVFTLYPVTGNQINIVTGINKLVFVLLTVLLCAVVFDRRSAVGEICSCCAEVFRRCVLPLVSSAWRIFCVFPKIYFL